MLVPLMEPWVPLLCTVLTADVKVGETLGLNLGTCSSFLGILRCSVLFAIV
jgi:hypothetical protein